MTYYPDLSQYQYFTDSRGDKRAANVGWLDDLHDFATAIPSPPLLDSLWRYAAILVQPTRGVHECEICGDAAPNYFRRHGVTFLLGTAEIRVFGPTGEVFAAPNLVFHYVRAHHYCPPQSFLDAVKYGPDPTTDRYRELLGEHRGTTWRDNSPVTEKPRIWQDVRTSTGEFVREYLEPKVDRCEDEAWDWDIPHDEGDGSAV